MIVFKVERAKFYDLLDGLISRLDGLMVDLQIQNSLPKHHH